MFYIAFMGGAMGAAELEKIMRKIVFGLVGKGFGFYMRKDDRMWFKINDTSAVTFGPDGNTRIERHDLKFGYKVRAI